MEYGAAVIIDELTSLELTEASAAAAAIYDQPISLRLLHEERGGGEEHYLVRYPAGLRAGRTFTRRRIRSSSSTDNSTRTAASSAPVLTRTSPRGK